jgi:hypothetical protein
VFAVLWWLVVIGTVGLAVSGAGYVWDVYRRDAAPHPTRYVVPIVYVLLAALVPFGIMTATRWIITSRWRFGPRW